MAYSDETNTAVIDAKLLLDRILYDDNYHNTLSCWGISRKSLSDEVWRPISDLIYDKRIPYSAESGAGYVYDTTDPDQVKEALFLVHAMFSGIDDAWFWTENENVLNGIMNELGDIVKDL